MLGVWVWQVPIKYVIMPLLVFIKFYYTIKKGFCNPSSTEQACAWNQSTKKKEVVPKRTADLFVRKRLASSKNKNLH